jgi:hypothetical protein
MISVNMVHVYRKAALFVYYMQHINDEIFKVIKSIVKIICFMYIKLPQSIF